MPAKVFGSDRAMVTAGFANKVAFGANAITPS